MPTKHNKKVIFREQNLQYLKDNGYELISFSDIHYRCEPYDFWPSTGKYWNKVTGERGQIKDLPPFSKIEKKQKSAHFKKKKEPIAACNRYYNLDKRYLPDWVLAPERQEWLKTFITKLKK